MFSGSRLAPRLKIQLEFAIEITDTAIPICLAVEFDESAHPVYTGLHYGPKNGSDEDVSRSMYADTLYRTDPKNCK